MHRQMCVKHDIARRAIGNEVSSKLFREGTGIMVERRGRD